MAAIAGTAQEASPLIAPFDRARDQVRWDAYVRSHPTGVFTQLAAYRDILVSEYGVVAEWWIATRGARVVGVLPTFVRRVRGPVIFTAPGGMLRDDDDVAAAFVSLLENRVAGGGMLYAEFRDQRTEVPGLPTSREHVTLVLDLAPSEDEQFAGFGSKLRNSIRKSQRTPFGISWSRTDVEAFYGVLLENMRDHGTPIRHARYFRALLDAYGNDARLLVLRIAASPIASMFTVRHGTVVSDPWASSSRRFLSVAPNEALYWEAIRQAIADGAAQFDFGRSQPGSGTFFYKRKWGARVVPLAYQYVFGKKRTIPTIAEQKNVFSLAVNVWKRLPLTVAAPLGDRVKRIFPEVL